jgi:glycosyltransferase involved in cell wall biosynthesis
MRVLMLGWEFPPHISGGLGTACQGLTRGLAHHGVDVLFVVPRAYGDEENDAARVVGCDAPEPRARLGGAGPAEPRSAGGPPGATSSSSGARSSFGSGARSAGGSAAPGERSYVVVPSPLRPYLTEHDLPGATSHGAGGDAAGIVGGHPLPIAAEDWSKWVAELAAHAADRDGPGIGGSRGYRFSGGYGAGLYEEVARLAEAVVDLSRDEPFDLVHAHDWMTFPAGAAVARARGVPLAIHVHATEHDRSGGRPGGRTMAIEQLGLDAADRVIAVSHYTAGVLRRTYRVDPARIRVVHNAVNQERMLEACHVQRRIRGPLVLFLGRVTLQKGPDYFLQAAALVVRRRPDVKFVVSGSGDMLPKLVERSAELGIARNVHFTGFLRGEGVERMFAQADLYVMPSVSEPFGISALEAMALDVPVIVSRQSGVSEVLRHALKVDFWDVDELANKILAVLRHSPLRRELVQGARDEVRRMRWELRGALVREIYEEMLS